MNKRSYLTLPGLKPKQPTQALLTLGSRSRHDIHFCLSAFCFLVSGTQCLGLATWLDSTFAICPYRIPSHWRILLPSLGVMFTPECLSHHLCSDLLSTTRLGARPVWRSFFTAFLAGRADPEGDKTKKQEKTDLTKLLKVIPKQSVHFW